MAQKYCRNEICITLDEATLVLNRVYENISKLRDSYEEIKSEAKKWQGIGE